MLRLRTSLKDKSTQSHTFHFSQLKRRKYRRTSSRQVNSKSLELLSFDYEGPDVIPDIKPEVIAQAVSKFETFQANGGLLTITQISAVFTELSVVKNHKLKSLDLPFNDLTSVPTDILVGAINGMKWVNLFSTGLTTQQLSEIYRMVADRRCSRMREINLSFNDITDISQDLRERAKQNQSVRMKDDM